MAKLIISNNGVNVQEYALQQERVTIGRIPVNDIIL
ncbi:MAG: hypothetical protein GWN77_02250, partial [Gammaproteobacteria bacterium]|nr:hypothetical protein [Gammaproteobacteria bacterium]